MTFKDQLAADLDAVFFNTDEFADFALFEGVMIKGIFSKEYVVLEDVETCRPMFETKASNVTGAAQGKTLVIKSVTYKIIEIEPDPDGLITTLILSRD